MADESARATAYCGAMEEIKQRLSVVDAILDARVSAGQEFSNAELAFVQVRKSLELLAFASLSAHHQKYAKAYADFRRHWNAKKLLAKLGRVHPNFYPRPVRYAGQRANGAHHYDDLAEGYLTPEDFVFLYDRSSQVLHARNPFSDGGSTIELGRHLSEWVERIRALLQTHYVEIAGGYGLWLVMMAYPADGRVHAFLTVPTPARDH